MYEIKEMLVLLTSRIESSVSNKTRKGAKAYLEKNKLLNVITAL